MVIRRRLPIKGPALAFITTTVKDHLPIFTQQNTADALILQLKESFALSGDSLVGYVLMPSHIHLLMGMKKIENLSRFIQTFKSLSSRRIKRLNLGRFDNQLRGYAHFRLWRPRFDDVIIQSEKQFRVKLDYIHNNPVKAGLVSNAVDWKYSSASDWLANKPGLIRIDKRFTWT